MYEFTGFKSLKIQTTLIYAIYRYMLHAYQTFMTFSPWGTGHKVGTNFGLLKIQIIHKDEYGSREVVCTRMGCCCET